MELGADILANTFHYRKRMNITYEKDPIFILHKLVWNTNQDILRCKTEAELDQIQGKFFRVHNFLLEPETTKMAGIA